MWKISRCKYLPLSGAGLAKGTKVFSLKVAKMSTRLVPRMLGQILDRGSNPFPRFADGRCFIGPKSDHCQDM